MSHVAVAILGTTLLIAVAGAGAALAHCAQIRDLGRAVGVFGWGPFTVG